MTPPELSRLTPADTGRTVWNWRNPRQEGPYEAPINSYGYLVRAKLSDTNDTHRQWCNDYRCRAYPRTGRTHAMSN